MKHNNVIILSIGAVTALSGCSAGGISAADTHWKCAAALAATNKLIADGSLKPSVALLRGAPGAQLIHLGAYARSAKLDQLDALQNIVRERDELLKIGARHNLITRAESCIKSAE